MGNILNLKYSELLKKNDNYEKYLINIDDIIENKFKIQIDKIIQNKEIREYLKDKLLVKNELGFPVQYSENLILFQKDAKAYKIIISLTIILYLLFLLFLLGIPIFIRDLITLNFTGFIEFIERLVVLVLIPFIYLVNVIGEYISEYVLKKNKLKAILFPFNKVGRNYIYTVLFTKGLTFTKNNYTNNTYIILYKDYGSFDDLIQYNQDLSKLDGKSLNILKKLYINYKNLINIKK